VIRLAASGRRALTILTEPRHSSAATRQAIGADAPRECAAHRPRSKAARAIDRGMVVWLEDTRQRRNRRKTRAENATHGGRGRVVRQTWRRSASWALPAAEPGEFTRAQLRDGTLDLTQAEAISRTWSRLKPTSSARSSMQRWTVANGIASYEDWRTLGCENLAHLEGGDRFHDEDCRPGIAARCAPVSRS